MKELKEVFDELQEVLKNSSLKGDERNEHYGYSYITLNQIKKLLAPLFKKHNMMCIPEVKTIDTKILEGNQALVTVWIILRFVAFLPREDGMVAEYSTEITTAGQAVDTQGKALAKATTDALKRAFLNMFMIATEDEEDEDKTYGKEQKQAEKSEERPASESQKAVLRKIFSRPGTNLQGILAVEGITDIENISMQKASELIQKYGRK